MKHLFASIALLSACPLSFGQHGVNFSWQPGPSPGWAVCPSTSNCLSGFTFYEITTGTPVSLAVVPQTTTNFDITPPPTIGSHTYQVVQDAIDSTGAPVQSVNNPGVVIWCYKVNPPTPERKCV